MCKGLFSLFNFFASLSVPLLLFLLREEQKIATNFALCWVSLGGGNEGLHDSYFIPSIIYGEARFRKGHCTNMGGYLS